jgi:diguanylate cyclase (GGDEF)-like protein
MVNKEPKRLLAGEPMPALATPVAVATTTALFTASVALGAAALDIAYPWADRGYEARLLLADVAVVAAAVSVLSFARRASFPRWAHRAINFGGLVLLTCFVLFSGQREMSGAAAVVYVYIPVSSFLFCRLWAAALTEMVAAACIAVEGSTGRIPGAEAVTLVTATVALSTVIASLVRSAQQTAVTDQLTGLPNRSALEARLQLAVVNASRTGQALSLALIDVDRLDLVNRRMGQDAADDLLRRVARILRGALSQRVLVARYGGGSFAVVFEGLDVQEAKAASERLHASVDGELSCSVGLTQVAPNDSALLMLGRARSALFEAKQPGRDRSTVRVNDWRQADELATAITDGQLRVLYQPIVSLPTGELVGCEALVRWQHPEHGMVPPDKFIPVAEETGLIVELGREVLRQSALAMSSWPWGIRVSVNASGPELDRPEFALDLLHSLSHTGLSPKRLVIEVTESRLENDSSVMLANLNQLRRYGVRIALDDFGTGYSSLSRLSNLPIDYVKIDRSFVSAITEEATEAPIISAVCTLARATGIMVVAEGIETPQQARVLFDNGCNLGQGYHFGRPGPVEALLDMKGGLPRRTGHELPGAEPTDAQSSRRARLRPLAAHEATSASAFTEAMASPGEPGEVAADVVGDAAGTATPSADPLPAVDGAPALDAETAATPGEQDAPVPLPRARTAPRAGLPGGHWLRPGPAEDDAELTEGVADTLQGVGAPPTGH